MMLQRKAESLLLVTSPQLEYICTRGTPLWCSTLRGGTRPDRPMCRVPPGPAGSLGQAPNELDGLSCMHQLFPGRKPHYKNPSGFRKGLSMKKNESLFMQDSPGTSPTARKSHRFKFHWRKTVFQFAFKGLEILLMILQILQCLCEMFKK